ncbi:MAG TPA: peptidase M61 [Sphingomicrobium sp.]
MNDILEAGLAIDRGSATTSKPMALAEPPAAPEPQDVPYAGTMVLHVDVTDVERRIFRVRQTIPVSRPEHTTLIYPKWLPGLHAPQAPIELFAGLTASVAGEPVTWKRHQSTINVFTIDVPDGTTAIDVEFQFLSPTDASQGRVLCTGDLLCLPWNTVLLYPAGHYVRQIEVQASLTLPEGWDLACAVEQQGHDGDTRHFAPVPLDVLVDSPVLAGRYFRRIPLTDGVHLNLAADEAHQLDATADQIAPHRGVVEQADRLFGARHFDRFEMLLALSDELTSAGVEHHRSFEAVSSGEYFTDWQSAFLRRDTVPHEYLHSWNGKYRRGDDSWSPCFEKPIRNSLMWVYEGLTQYWTHVLSARSGMWSAEQTIGAMAMNAARYDVRPGSRWRPTIDTTRDPIIAARAPLPWSSWQRSEDYYAEGALIWLDVDTRIRELSGETRSLDDFAKAFFGRDDGSWQTSTYDFDEVVRTLDGIVAFDWQGFFAEQLTETHDRAPLGGIERGGYRLVYRDQPSDYQAGYEKVFEQIDLTHSLGLTVSPAGKITDVLWDGPAFEAGLTVGTKIAAVGGRVFAPDALRRAVAAGQEVRLDVTKGKAARSVVIPCRSGPRYPQLERQGDGPCRLDLILAPVELAGVPR